MIHDRQQLLHVPVLSPELISEQFFSTLLHESIYVHVSLLRRKRTQGLKDTEGKGTLPASGTFLGVGAIIFTYIVQSKVPREMDSAIVRTR